MATCASYAAYYFLSIGFILSAATDSRRLHQYGAHLLPTTAAIFDLGNVNVILVVHGCENFSVWLLDIFQRLLLGPWLGHWSIDQFSWS